MACFQFLPTVERRCLKKTKKDRKITERKKDKKKERKEGKKERKKKVRKKKQEANKPSQTNLHMVTNSIID